MIISLQTIEEGRLVQAEVRALSRRVARGKGGWGFDRTPNNCAVTFQKRLRRRLASAALRFGGLALLPV